MLPVFLIQLFIFFIAPVVMTIFILYKTFNSKYRMEQIENMGNHADGVIIEKKKSPKEILTWNLWPAGIYTQYL